MFKKTSKISSTLSAMALLSLSLFSAEITPGPSAAMAPESDPIQTLYGGKLKLSGFGGPTVNMTKINGKLGILMGGHGAFLINHCVTIGAGGYGLANFIKIGENAGSSQYLQMGYGGPEFGFIINPKKLVNASVNLLCGGGTVSWQSRTWGTAAPGEPSTSPNGIYAFYVVEPAVCANLNVAPVVRISAGIKYRYVDGLEADWITNEDLRGVSGSLAVMFGGF